MPDSEDATSPAADLPHLLDATLAAARKAGELAAARFCTEVRCQRKSDGSPVTEVDLAVDALLRERLMAALPEAGWLSEESTQGHGWLRHERVWVVDPLDGTGGFLRRDPHWCIAIALIEQGRAVLGVIHAPALERTWWAHARGGALINDTTARVSARTTLQGARIIGPKRLLDASAWETPWPPLEVRRYPSLALRLAYVASGDADGMIALGGKNYWDVAAGDIIVREAGGVAGDMQGRSLRYDHASARVGGVIAAPEGLFGEMAALAKGWRGCCQHGKHGIHGKHGQQGQQGNHGKRGRRQ